METKIELSEGELNKLIETVVHSTLVRLGLDATDPIEVQKDFAHLRVSREAAATIAEDLRFARELREGSQAARRTIFMAIGGALVTFLGTIFYLGWKAFNAH